MENAVADFCAMTEKQQLAIAGAIYHLSASPQGDFIIASLGEHSYAVDLVYHGKGNTDQAAIDRLKPDGVTFHERTATNIMLDNFLVSVDGAGKAYAVIMGSANYTTEGLTQQANLIHAFGSPELAELYYERQKLLRDNPTLSATRKAHAGWPQAITVGDATIRVIFSPEALGSREGLDAIVAAVKNAKSSVVFCLYDSTDQPLLDACLAAQTRGLMMQGLVNLVPETEPNPTRMVRHRRPFKWRSTITASKRTSCRSSVTSASDRHQRRKASRSRTRRWAKAASFRCTSITSSS